MYVSSDRARDTVLKRKRWNAPKYVHIIIPPCPHTYRNFFPGFVTSGDGRRKLERWIRPYLLCHMRKKNFLPDLLHFHALLVPLCHPPTHHPYQISATTCLLLNVVLVNRRCFKSSGGGGTGSCCVDTPSSLSSLSNRWSPPPPPHSPTSHPKRREGEGKEAGEA